MCSHSGLTRVDDVVTEAPSYFERPSSSPSKSLRCFFEEPVQDESKKCRTQLPPASVQERHPSSCSALRMPGVGFGGR